MISQSKFLDDYNIKNIDHEKFKLNKVKIKKTYQYLGNNLQEDKKPIIIDEYDKMGNLIKENYNEKDSEQVYEYVFAGEKLNEIKSKYWDLFLDYNDQRIAKEFYISMMYQFSAEYLYNDSLHFVKRLLNTDTSHYISDAFFYDGRNNLLDHFFRYSETDTFNYSIKNYYNKNNQLTKSVYRDPFSPPNINTFKYELNGRVIEEIQNNDSIVIEKKYEYDNSSRLKFESTKANNFVYTEYKYDKKGLLIDECFKVENDSILKEYKYVYEYY